MYTKILSWLNAKGNMVLTGTQNQAQKVWRKYRSYSKRTQIIIAVVVVLLLLASHSIIGYFTKSPDVADVAPTVTLSSVSDLAGTGSTASIIGAIRSVAEASILAESGGKITSVNTALGRTVGAGAVLAQIDNASQRATVLQAEGAYESALASRQGMSPGDVTANARNTYSSAYSSVDSIVKSYIDTFYRGQGSAITEFTISSVPFDQNYFTPKRRELQQSLDLWKSHLATAQTGDPQTLLNEADSVTKQAIGLASDIATAANQFNSNATPAQQAALVSARSGLSGVQASIVSARQVNKSQSASATLGADASVKTALGSLRAAQAVLEKTLIRTPIGGTVNFFPIHRGDYVTPLMHVATVAQNGALEIVAFVSENTRADLTVGQKVKVEDKYDAVITSISPALDPVTKQIEIHIGLTGKADLIDGQSVHISITSSAPSAATPAAVGPILLPLTAVKLTPSARVVFTVGEDGRLVSHEVSIGDVVGDRIEVLTVLPGELRIVTDARGLSEGEKVQVATQ
jgi:multidrug efflux pump subunit AcrA (membrane-fusion protein)